MLVAVGLTYVLVRLGGTVGELTSYLKGSSGRSLPVINEAGGTLQRVNAQLDKADLVTDSAVDIADSVDTAVRAVTLAITRPVQKVSGLAEGIATGSRRSASARARAAPTRPDARPRSGASRRSRTS